MPRVTYIEPAGEARHVDVPAGESVMRGAKLNGVEGIAADCGGACQCGTCHVHVDPAWTDRVGKPNAMEEAMLEFAEDVGPTSRLSCQIRMSEALDGLIVEVVGNR